MSKKNPFENNSQQGEFGEYLYIEFCKKNNIDCNRVNKFGRDIDLANAKIDVKTSRTKKTGVTRNTNPMLNTMLFSLI